MSLFQQKAPILISCQRRLQPALEQEFRSYGWKPTEVFETGLRWEGTLADTMALNLRLRTASSVLYQLSAFSASHPDQIYEQVRRYPWEEVLDPKGYFSVSSQVFHETVNNNLYVNLRVKDGIVDRFQARTGSRPVSGPDREGAVIHLYWKGDRAILYLDSSGHSLARHGYRKIPGRAPMLESLAAATILLGKWDRQSPFVNPMCGSGTLAIEAALIATGTAPGLFHDQFGFMAVLGYDAQAYHRLRMELENEISEPEAPFIFASDLEARAVDQARKNAKAAGVAELIDFQVCDFRAVELPPGPPGVLYFNPEYGQRLGEAQKLQEIYKQIGDFMKQKASGYWGYVFTANLELAKLIGLRPDRRIPFYNAKLDARLLEYELYKGSKNPGASKA